MPQLQLSRTTTPGFLKYSCFALLLLLMQTGQAQEKPFIVTLNIPGIIVKNYSFKAEKVLNKRFSAVLHLRFMPTSTLPFKNQLRESYGTDDPDMQQTFDKLKVGNFALTPEVRWYTGRHGYGRGFYLAAFYRYARFTSNSLPFTVETTLSTREVTLSGDFTGHTGGLQLGYQWFLGKRVVLDWWILGAHAGGGNGVFSSTISPPLTPAEQNDLRNELEDLDIPWTEKTVTVNANSASLSLKGPWGGIRAGLAVGVRL